MTSLLNAATLASLVSHGLDAVTFSIGQSTPYDLYDGWSQEKE